MTNGKGLLHTAVVTALAEHQVKPEDQGTAALALTYANAIDAGNEAILAALGPLLLNALDALLMTTKARAAAMKGATDAKPAASRLDELRARRARKNSAATVDPAATGADA